MQKPEMCILVFFLKLLTYPIPTIGQEKTPNRARIVTFTFRKVSPAYPLQTDLVIIQINSWTFSRQAFAPRLCHVSGAFDRQQLCAILCPIGRTIYLCVCITRIIHLDTAIRASGRAQLRPPRLVLELRVIEVCESPHGTCMAHGSHSPVL